MELRRRSIKLMGALIETAIYVENKEVGEKILDEVIDLLHKYNMIFSANDSTSELMEINKNAGKKEVRVRDELFSLINISKVNSLEEGFFNVALGPIIQSWRIGFSDAKVPSDEEIERLLPLTNPENIVLNKEKRTVFLKKEGMQINLGAIAKGYIADLIVDFLKSKKVTAGFINLGGNFLTFGDAFHNEDKYWKVGIQNPKMSRGNHVCVVKVKDKSVVTSGVYERVLEAGGKKYYHILNPKTGYPVETTIEGLTIISDKSVDGEIWTTRLYGMQLEDIFDKVESNDYIEAIVVTKEGQVFCSSGAMKYIV